MKMGAYNVGCSASAFWKALSGSGPPENGATSCDESSGSSWKVGFIGGRKEYRNAILAIA